MSAEHDWKILYQKTQEQIKQQELLLYALYQQRTFIRSQILEQALNKSNETNNSFKC
ncbi:MULTISPECIES: hypothetical protein [Okeania]|uniref:hypothetical protein n=1 Tax=Okeania TaxID=1458928 RepID=UPI001374FFBC|nr:MULTISPECIES: hypothetical protein [Okeania]NET11656.1 hypothetical protein [Okeania sp. SIO1H6]NEP73281.1 hypothetical protein [Okeania sp. SIO2G5]NEP91695.1 hypothetical protein [Okeania sp. SIO2F5]NEQ89522.1 hypothetical protein [Okeania sp. SIO2G4]NES75905.1 hypothetical protein [Okeania sp. SIO1H4]